VGSAHRKTTYGEPLSPTTLFIKSFFYKLYFIFKKGD